MRARLCVWGSPKNGRSPGKRSNVSSGEASASWDISFFFPFVKSREPTFLYIFFKQKQRIQSREIIRSILEFSRNYKIQGFESVTLFTRNFSWKGGRLAENIYIQISGWIHASVNIVCAHFAAQTAT